MDEKELACRVAASQVAMISVDCVRAALPVSS